MPSLLGNTCMLAGYTLVYAAVVGGRVPAYAKDPWLGIVTDAYLIDPTTGLKKQSGSGRQTPPTGAGGLTGPTNKTPPGPGSTRGTVPGQSPSHTGGIGGPPGTRIVGPTGPVGPAAPQGRRTAAGNRAPSTG